MTGDCRLAIFTVELFDIEIGLFSDDVVFEYGISVIMLLPVVGVTLEVNYGEIGCVASVERFTVDVFESRLVMVI